MSIYQGENYIAGIPGNYVTTNTNQDIGGAKTFTALVRLRNSEGESAIIAPNRISFNPLSTASNGGYIDFHYASESDYTSRIIEEGKGYLRIETRNPNDSTQITSLFMGYRSGNYITRCPASAADNSILTNVSTGNDYAKLGNGLIIQWGEITSTGSQTITFPQPFSAADSYAMGMIGRTGDSSFTDSITNLTETGFTANRRSGTFPFRWIAIGK